MFVLAFLQARGISVCVTRADILCSMEDGDDTLAGWLAGGTEIKATTDNATTNACSAVRCNAMGCGDGECGYLT